MSSCATERLERERTAHAFAAWGVSVLLLTALPVTADEPDTTDADAVAAFEARAEFTLGARFYVIDSPQDNDNIGGFWDQYRQTRKKNADPPTFIDVLHSDLGLARDDDTWLLHLESWSPNANNDHVAVDAGDGGVEIDIDYRRYRSEDLRVFPEGTFQGQNPPSPIFPFGTEYTPDASDAEVLDSNRRLFLQRTGIHGELRFRPEGFDLDLPLLAEASLRSGFERRKGFRQDRFLLDIVELAPSNQRFRGNRRKLDQEVSNVGGAVVVSPGGDWVTDFDVSFESFREKADPVLFSDIAASDPSIPTPTGNTALRAFDFVPNTDRVSGSMRVAGPVGPASVQAGAFATHLKQTNKAPLQRSLGIDKQALTTWSAHLGFDLPLTDGAKALGKVGLNGFAKFSERLNDLDENDFEGNRQIAPILRRRSELEAQLELTARPLPGALVGTGYRFDSVDRNLRYAAPPGVIQPPLSLVEKDGQTHTVYLRARTRLLRRMQLRGELGWQYAPQRSFPRDPTYTVYFDGRGSYTLPRPFPLTLSVYGGVRDGHGNGKVLTGESTQARKDLDRLQWSYGATATALPMRRVSLTLSFIEQRDEQDFPYLRTDVPRTAGPSFTNFLPGTERPHYRSDVKSLANSLHLKLPADVDLRLFSSVSWVRADYSDARSDSSNTSRVLESASEVKSRILSAGSGVGWTAREGLRFDLGYRFDDYVDHRDRGALIDPDDRRHTFTVAMTVDLGVFSGAARTRR